jgi:hypothetical protein
MLWLRKRRRRRRRRSQSRRRRPRSNLQARVEPRSARAPSAIGNISAKRRALSPPFDFGGGYYPSSPARPDDPVFQRARAVRDLIDSTCGDVGSPLPGGERSICAANRVRASVLTRDRNPSPQPSPNGRGSPPPMSLRLNLNSSCANSDAVCNTGAAQYGMPRSSWGMTVRIYRSASASLAPSAAKPPAKARRSHLITFGCVTMRSRTPAANRP